MTSATVSNAMYVILGASGNTASIIADFLLSKGEKVRVVGRDVGAATALCTQRRGGFPGVHDRCGCAHQSLHRRAGGIRDTTAAALPRRARGPERCDRER